MLAGESVEVLVRYLAFSRPIPVLVAFCQVVSTDAAIDSKADALACPIVPSTARVSLDYLAA